MQALVLFDFDGTLADSAYDLAEAANRQRARQRLAPLPYETLRPHASHGARGLLKAALDLDASSAHFNEVRQQFLLDYAEIMNEHTTLFPGIRELLERLQEQNYGWGIVTNKTEALTWPMVRYLGLEHGCQVVVCGDTTPHIKPHPAPLLHAASQAGWLPRQCLYIGDDARDIQAGKAAGMATVAAGYGYCSLDDPTQWGADAIAQVPTDLWPLIERWAGTTLQSQVANQPSR